MTYRNKCDVFDIDATVRRVHPNKISSQDFVAAFISVELAIAMVLH